jgi:hypothetical protein
MQDTGRSNIKATGASQEMMKAQMDINQEDMTASQEIKAGLDKMKATVRASQEDRGHEN